MTEEKRKEGILKQCKGLPSVVEKYIDFLITKINKLVVENKRKQSQIEKMKKYLSCEYCKHYDEPYGCKECDEENKTKWKLKE